MQSGISDIGIWSRLSFIPELKPLINCNVWVCTAYILEPNVHNTGVKITEWDPRIQIGVNMGFSKIQSA